jgi:transposase
MGHYVGLDVSLKLTSICVVDQTGSVVREGVVDSDHPRQLPRSLDQMR